MEDSTHAELIARARKIHAILHVAAGHPEDDEQDAAALRRVLKHRDAISQLADALEKAVERNAVLEKVIRRAAKISTRHDHEITRLVDLQEILLPAAQALSKQGEG